MYSEEEIQRDIERVRSIAVIPNLLDVICETTGMGFAAVARVTETRWITCSVRDDIRFGLVPGSELEIRTTICDEIRDSHQPVIIDHVRESPQFCNHHTPLMYGFQSYISFPIVLKSGMFFGTLCAIDPEPRQLQKSGIVKMFAAFTELIAFHLEQSDLLSNSSEINRELNRQLINSRDENRQYQHITSHTLQEPLRKLSVFTGMLINAISENQLDKAELLALRIKRGADRFSLLIKDLTDFSNLNAGGQALQQTDLSEIIDVVQIKMQDQLDAKTADVLVGNMPVIQVYPDQMAQLFYHLFDNAIKFSRPGTPLKISVTSGKHIADGAGPQLSADREYVEIRISDNGIGIEESQLEQIFDIFSQLPTEIFVEGVGSGLSLCRKIVRNHFGQITIDSSVGLGTVVSVILPLEKALA